MEPKGRQRRFSDEELRSDLDAGLKPVEIARKYSVSAAAVSKRINRLELTTVAAAVAPEESRRYVGGTLNAMEELVRGLRRVNLVQDACHDWLLAAPDPDRPGERYDIGARPEEIEVTYTVEVEVDGPRGETRYRTEKRRAKLSSLLAVCEEDPEGSRITGVTKSESKYADPRELVLRTVSEARQTVETGARLLQMLRDAEAMELFREEMLRAIGEADEETRGRIEERLRARLVRYAAASGLGALPGG